MCVALALTVQAIDAAFLQFTVGKVLQRSASVHLLFAFEYVIQVPFLLDHHSFNSFKSSTC